MANLPLEDYHIGWICALSTEMAVAMAMLDEDFGIIGNKSPQDANTYSAGRVHGHNVVIACLPAGVDGTTAAATVANNMLRTFTGLRFALMVGIGGGIPDLENGIDIRLGDVVVSQPRGTNGGVIQYDKGKALEGGKFERKGSLNAPPSSLLTALNYLQARHQSEDSSMSTHVAEMIQRKPMLKENGYIFPGVEQDRLYQMLDPQSSHGTVRTRIVDRQTRTGTRPHIHYGVIASGNLVVKDASVRDLLRKEYGAICVEMEAAGLMNNLPCLVIRGICDYADAHKNDVWHKYAAATAAAYAKELLQFVSAGQTSQEKPIQEILGE